MSNFFLCSYLDSEVELTSAREQHIIANHPGTLPDYFDRLQETLIAPDLIRQSARDVTALLFSKWFDTIRTGRHMVVVVVTNTDPNTDPKRYWIITAYTARKLSGGTAIWNKA